jgi:hypothetical protein
MSTCPKRLIVSKPWVSLSRVHTLQQWITYIVHCWYMGAYAIVLIVLLCHSDHRFLFSQPHEDALTPGPPADKAKSCNIKSYDALIYHKQARQLFPTEVFWQIAQWWLVWLPQMMYIWGSGGKIAIISNGSYDQTKYLDPLIYTPIWYI